MLTGMMSSAFKKIKQSQNPNIGGSFGGMAKGNYTALFNNLNGTPVVPQVQQQPPVSAVPQPVPVQQQVMQPQGMQQQIPQQPAMAQPINYRPSWRQFVPQLQRRNPYGFFNYFSNFNQPPNMGASSPYFNYRL